MALANIIGAAVPDLTASTETLVDMLKSMLGLFSEFPLNIILVASLCGVAFKLFRKGKNAAGGN